MLKLVPSFKDAQILKPCLTTRSRVTLTQGNSRRQRSPPPPPSNFTQARSCRLQGSTMHIPSIFHYGPRPPRRKFTAVHTDFKRSIVNLPGNTKWVKRDQTPIPKDPFSWKKRLSLGRVGRTSAGRRRRRRTLGPTGCCASQLKTPAKGRPGLQDAKVRKSGLRPPGPWDRQGGGAGTRGPEEPYLPLPLPASVYSGV